MILNDFIYKIDNFCGYKNEWKIRKDSETSDKYGYYPEKRPIEIHIKNSIINLDKPPGPTSHEVAYWVKKMLNVTKAGHGGTLDPKVTGVLPIGIENATKIMNYISKGGKEYVCVMQVHCEYNKEELAKIISSFKGEIYQRPPVRSSVKRRLRIRRIYDIEILDMDKKLVLLRVNCDSGTYMRKLCHDIGIIYGCGAHMRELRRTRSGIFTESTNLVKLHELSEAIYLYKNCKDETELRRVLIPMEFATCEIPKIVIEDSAVNALAYGAQLAVPGVVAYQNFKKNDTVAVLTLKGELVATGNALMDSEELENAKKGIVVNLSRVFMQRDIYPKAWKKHES